MVRLTGKPVLFGVSVHNVTQGFPWQNPQDFVCKPLGRTQRSSDDSQWSLCGLSLLLLHLPVRQTSDPYYFIFFIRSIGENSCMESIRI